MTFHLHNARAALARGDKSSALISLREALKHANAANDRRAASCIFRALNYARAI